VADSRTNGTNTPVMTTSITIKQNKHRAQAEGSRAKQTHLFSSDDEPSLACSHFMKGIYYPQGERDVITIQ
jgi:hypothetical protein